MDLLSKIQHDLSEGVVVLKKGSTSFILKGMTSVDFLKSRFDVYKIQGSLSELYRDLGERFINAVEERDFNILSKDEVRDVIERIDNIRIAEERNKKDFDNLRDFDRFKGE